MRSGTDVDAADPRSLTARILATGVVNLSMTGVSAVTGVLVARALGPSGRGELAAVTSVFGLTLVIGEVGQTAAIAYHVARYRALARDYIATSAAILLVTGLVAALLGVGFSSRLARGSNDLAVAFNVMAIVLFLNFAAAAFLFALQAVHIGRWNTVRVVQPALYLLGVLVLIRVGRASVLLVCVGLGISIVVQCLIAVLMARSSSLVGGLPRIALVRPLLTYGVVQMAAAGPASVVARVDQVVLSRTVSTEELGNYAVAVTLVTLIVPVVGAIGTVVFPELARGGRRASAALQRRALHASWVLSGATALGVVVAAPVVLPLLFGQTFHPAVHLAWLLAPSGMFLAVGAVVGDLLRGHGRPGRAAKAQLFGVAVMLGLLAFTVPRWGAPGAAVSATTSAGLTLIVLYVGLVRLPESTEP